MENIWTADKNTRSDYYVAFSKTPYMLTVGYAEDGQILVTKDVSMDVFTNNQMDRTALKNALGVSMYKTALEGIEKWANYLLKNVDMKRPAQLSKSEINFNKFINDRIKEGAKEIIVTETKYYDNELSGLTSRTILTCMDVYFEFYGIDCIDFDLAIKLIPKALKIIDKRI